MSAAVAQVTGPAVMDGSAGERGQDADLVGGRPPAPGVDGVERQPGRTGYVQPVQTTTNTRPDLIKMPLLGTGQTGAALKSML